MSKGGKEEKYGCRLIFPTCIFRSLNSDKGTHLFLIVNVLLNLANSIFSRTLRVWG